MAGDAGTSRENQIEENQTVRKRIGQDQINKEASVDFFRSLMIAFSMYSRLPVPRVRWDERTARYVLLCFPAVGIIEGGLLLLLAQAGRSAGVPALLCAVMLTAFPYLYTGGIHLDGFLDTVDALGSWRSREERLAILRDVHTGSFAVLVCSLLCIAQTAAWAELLRLSARRAEAALRIVAVSFVLSRGISALSLLLLPNARGEGSAYRFSAGAERRLSVCGAVFWIAASAAAIPLAGGGSVNAAAVLISVFAAACYGCMRARAAFGGMTGDTAGFLLTICEVSALWAAVIF